MRPNLLLLFTDMQRWDTIAALGNGVIRTPALDRLVREGTAFSDCFTPSPVCISARYAMHYGLWPSKTGVAENVAIPEDDGRSFADHLVRAGYRTHAVGKLHFGEKPGALRGFQSRDRQEEIVGDPASDDYLPYLQQHGFGHICDPHGVRGEMYYVPQVSQMPAEHHPTRWVADRSIDFIRSATSPAGRAKGRPSDDDQPWMLMSSFIHPHPPFAPPNPWHKLYRGFEMPVPVMPPDREALLTWINRMQNRGKYRDQGDSLNLIRLMKAYYYACISFVDAQVGRMLAVLEELGQLDNTLILFTSDHGEFLGDLGCFGKRSMHDPSTRVPMIIRHPGAFSAGQLVRQPVSLVDVPATFLAAAGLDAAAGGMAGEDLARVAGGKSARELVFSQCGADGAAQYMAVGREWKYFYSSADGREFLFDRRRDPGETRNRAGIPSAQDALRAMRTSLFTFLQQQDCQGALAAGTGGAAEWRSWPRREMPVDPDAYLGIQDHPWADQYLDGYTEGPPRPARMRSGKGR